MEKFRVFYEAQLFLVIFSFDRHTHIVNNLSTAEILTLYIAQTNIQKLLTHHWTYYNIADGLTIAIPHVHVYMYIVCIHVVRAVTKSANGRAVVFTDLHLSL